MRLAIMSDLHMEMHADRGRSFCQGLDPTDVDVLVLAGDIVSARFFDDMKAVFEILATKYPNIVYVLGNHEYYMTNPKQVNHNLNRLIAEFPSVWVLDNDKVTINGQRFVGGTMWYPQSWQVDQVKYLLNDRQLIKDFEPWVYNQNMGFRKLATEIEATDVVVTHHLPSSKCVAPMYTGSSLNCCFVSEMDAEILAQKPGLWIHGHTHEQVDMVLGDTRIVANPMGYPKELRNQSAFKERLIIEVTAPVVD